MNTIKCSCGKRAIVQHVTGYWCEIHCKHCGRYHYGSGFELEARARWIKGEFQKRGEYEISEVRKAMERAKIHYRAIQRLTSKNT